MIIQREAVRAILLTPQQEILLLRCRAPDTRECFWIAPGGGVEPGETVEAALQRELHEEVGLEQCMIGPLVWRREHTFNWAGKRVCQREQYHIVHVDRFEPFMHDAVEAKSLDQFRWWPVTDLAHSTERLTPLSLSNIMIQYLSEGTGPDVIEVEILID